MSHQSYLISVALRRPNRPSYSAANHPGKGKLLYRLFDIHNQVNSWKRPTEITFGDVDGGIPAEWTIVSPRRFELVEAPHVITETEKSMMKRKNIKLRPTMQEPYFNFAASNAHLDQSDVRLPPSIPSHMQLMRWTASIFGFFQRNGYGGLFLLSV